MLNSLLLRTTFIVLTIILLGSLSALAHDCPTLIEADCGGGTAWFGLRHDGAVLGQGQTVTLICDSAVLGVEFMFVVTGYPNGVVPSMVAGDEIHVVLADADGNHLTSATTAVPTDIFDDWLEFIFPENSIVAAGQYQLWAYTTVERQCAFRFGYGEGADCYAGGQRVTSVTGIDGPWGGTSLNDSPFRLHLREEQVANENRTWDSIKGLYR